jgi:DNA-binding Lrp family transcriptional regulator
MLSAKDQELLALLRVNAREPVAALARKLGLSRTTVNDRLRKLEKDGTISGYMVKLQSADPLGGLSALITLAAEPRRHIDVSKAVGKFSQVELLYAVSGKHDFVVKARTHSPEEMDRFIDQLVALPGVVEVETSVILSTKVDRR